MKIVIYEKKDYETEIIQNFSEKENIEIITSKSTLNNDTVNLCSGAEAISILGYSRLTKEILDTIKNYGVKFIATRTIGFNHIDINYAKVTTWEYDIR